MLIVLAVILLLVLPDPWNVVAALVVTGLWLVELYLWNRTVRGRRAAVGDRTLIGRNAVVSSALRPTGHVKLDGEIWSARCEAGASPGESVRVVGRDELTLIVEPAAQSP